MIESSFNKSNLSDQNSQRINKWINFLIIDKKEKTNKVIEIKLNINSDIMVKIKI